MQDFDYQPYLPKLRDLVLSGCWSLGFRVCFCEFWTSRKTNRPLTVEAVSETRLGYMSSLSPITLNLLCNPYRALERYPKRDLQRFRPEGLGSLSEVLRRWSAAYGPKRIGSIFA